MAQTRPPLISRPHTRFLLDGDDEVRDRVVYSLALLEDGAVSSFGAAPLSLSSLERALVEYAANPTEKPFDLKTVPIDTGVTKATDDMFEVADGACFAVLAVGSMAYSFCAWIVRELNISSPFALPQTHRPRRPWTSGRRTRRG
jgi:hypothetical protein